MKISYKHLKKTLDESVNESIQLQEEIPVEHHVKSIVLGKLMIPNLLNDCGDYCSHDEAITYYKASLLLDPFQKDLWGRMALNFHLNYENKKALKHIEKALAIDEQNVDHLELKQTILIDLRRFSEALFLFEQIDKLNPASSIAYFNRGKAFIKLGFYEKAIESLLRAMELDPEEKEIPFHLAKIYRFHLLDEALADKYEAMADLPSSNYLPF
jgi:tetratricopeptide (TPR) repeat protein